MVLDYYHQKLNVQDATRVVKQLKRKFQKNLKTEHRHSPFKNKNFATAKEDWTKSAIKHSLLDFIDWSQHILWRIARSSWFKTKSRLLLQIKGAVSSTKLKTIFRKKNKSFIYVLNSNMPRTDSCGTLWSNSFQELNHIFISVFCHRLDR